MLDCTNSRGVPPRVRYEMARARYQLNETAGRERLGRGASQQRSRPTRARDCGRATKYIYILLQWQAEWRSRHEGIDIAGELKYVLYNFFYNIHGANHRSHSHERAETAGELPQREQSCQKARRRDGGTTSWRWSLRRIFPSRASNDSVDENSRCRCSLRRIPRA